MSEITKKLVPERRFPEFHDSGKWAEYRLENFATFYKGKGVSKVDIDLKGKTPCIRYGELYTHYSEVINYVISRTNLPENELFFSKSNDVIIPASGETKWDIAKAACVMLDDVALGSDLNVIRTNQNGVFLSYYLNGVKKYEISKIAQGDSVVHLYSSQLKLINLFLPPKPEEQQKIANCLYSVDDLITAQTQKVEALKQHKKGLMQQLFPAEGETVPKLRFPEFEDDGEWELTTIGNLGSFYYGKSAPKWSLEENAPTPCVRYGELYTKFGAEITKTYSKTNIDPSNLRFSKGGEILVPRVGEKPEDFGKCCCFLPLKNIAIGEMISVFETKQNALFYTYYFRNMYKEFAKVVEGQNVKNLYYNQLEPLPIYRPPNLKEQQQIADCLSSLDALITIQSRKLEVLKEQKRGLMQQLFPSIVEVVV